MRLLARGQIEFGDDEPEKVESLDEGLAAFGLFVSGGLNVEHDEYWLWPENEDAFGMWLAIQTQWNAGMAGAIGLNYQGVEICLRMRGLKKKPRQHMFLLIQMMERACLDEWAQKRKH